MKIKLESIELEESTWKAFAVKNGWVESNSQSFLDFIVETYGSPIWQAVADFNLDEARALAQAKIEEGNQIMASAESQALDQAKQIVTVTIE
jgi:hypothetical protein